MPHLIEPKAWIGGAKDTYAGFPIRSDAKFSRDHFYASGRVEGEALRSKHRQEYEQLLFNGRQVRHISPQEPSHE